MTIIEAMRAGLSIVASDVGGVRETNEYGQKGFLVPEKDPEAFRNKLRILLTDPSLRQHTGLLGRQRHEREFAFDKMYERTLAVYKAAVFTNKRRIG